MHTFYCSGRAMMCHLPLVNADCNRCNMKPMTSIAYLNMCKNDSTPNYHKFEKKIKHLTSSSASTINMRRSCPCPWSSGRIRELLPIFRYIHVEEATTNVKNSKRKAKSTNIRHIQINSKDVLHKIQKVKGLTSLITAI
jgi:hypothetical protein